MDAQPLIVPASRHWVLPATALGLSLTSGAAIAGAAGGTLGLYFASAGFLVLLLPGLTLAAETPRQRALALAATLAGLGLLWPVVDDASWGRQLLSLLVLIAGGAAMTGVTLALLRLGLHPVGAAATSVSLGLIWLTWPIWLAPWLVGEAGESVAGILIPLHPLFALNAVQSDHGLWTEQGALMYHLTTLGQHVRIALPAHPWWSILGHGLLGAVLLGGTSSLRRRGAQEGHTKTRE